MKKFECLNKDKLYRLILDESQRQCLENLLHKMSDKNEMQLRLYNEIKETDICIE